MPVEYIPSFSEITKLVNKGNIVPVYKTVRADLETPVSAYLKVARGSYSFLLESVEGGENLGRYSMIGTEPYKILTAEHDDGDPLIEIEKELSKFDVVEVPGLPRFNGGAVGLSLIHI